MQKGDGSAAPAGPVTPEVAGRPGLAYTRISRNSIQNKGSRRFRDFSEIDQNKGPSAEICPLFMPSGLAYPRIFRNFIQNKGSKLRLLRARLRAAEEPLRRAADALAGRLRAGGPDAELQPAQRGVRLGA